MNKLRPQRPSVQKLIWSRALRKKQTPAEKLLGPALKAAAGKRYRVYSQKVIGGFILDFYLQSVKVAVEADGSAHDGNEKRDESRDAVLRDRFGILTLRFTNDEILAGPGAVADKVMRFADSLPSKPKGKNKS